MTKQVKTIEVLELVAKVEIPKVQQDQKFKGTAKPIRKAVIALLESYKDEAIKDGGDGKVANNLIVDYKNNKVTNKQISEIITLAFKKEFNDKMMGTIPVDKLSDSAIKLIEKAVDIAINSVIVRAVRNGNIEEIDGEVVAEQVLDILNNDDDFKKQSGGVTVNELIYGQEVKRGVGYDHILDMSPSQLTRYMNMSSV